MIALFEPALYFLNADLDFRGADGRMQRWFTGIDQDGRQSPSAAELWRLEVSDEFAIQLELYIGRRVPNEPEFPDRPERPGVERELPGVLIVPYFYRVRSLAWVARELEDVDGICAWSDNAVSRGWDWTRIHAHVHGLLAACAASTEEAMFRKLDRVLVPMDPWIET